MKNTALFAMCISIFVVLTACKKNDPAVENFKFPFKVGNQWTYKRTQDIRHVIAIDANKSIHDTTIVSEVHIILNEYTEDTGMKSIQLASTAGYRTCYSYYLNLNDALVSIIAGNAGLDNSDLFPHDLDKFFCNTIFRPKNLLKSALSQSDYYKVAVLKYPLEVNSKWTCDPLKNITKEVTGFEKIIFNSTSYDSYKLEYTYLKDSTAKTVDYISKIGLIKREVFINQIGVDGKGYGDYYETWELIDYNLK